MVEGLLSNHSPPLEGSGAMYPTDGVHAIECPVEGRNGFDTGELGGSCQVGLGEVEPGMFVQLDRSK